MPASPIAEFLRARRAQVHPAELGLPSSGNRRVPGLRREEVASIAGINVDYFARLEQGRERNPSAQVVEALARALRLDDDARVHLHQLAGNPAPVGPPAPTKPLPPELLSLLEHGIGGPGLILDARLDVLATNLLGRALYADFGNLDNLALMIFLDPAARDFHQPWERAAHAAVVGLRRACVADGGHARLEQLVAVLSRRSPEFVELWSSRYVQEPVAGVEQFLHPAVGKLTLHSQRFDLHHHPGLHMIVYHAKPNTPDADALSLVASLQAGQDSHRFHSS